MDMTWMLRMRLLLKERYAVNFTFTLVGTTSDQTIVGLLNQKRTATNEDL
jgi:hypothetical protein